MSLVCINGCLCDGCMACQDEEEDEDVADTEMPG